MIAYSGGGYGGREKRYSDIHVDVVVDDDDGGSGDVTSTSTSPARHLRKSALVCCEVDGCSFYYQPVKEYAIFSWKNIPFKKWIAMTAPKRIEPKGKKLIRCFVCSRN